MTAFTGTIQGLGGSKRAKKKIDKADLYDRYEITSSANNLKGEVLVPKGTTVAASDTVTLTVA